MDLGMDDMISAREVTNVPGAAPASEAAVGATTPRPTTPCPAAPATSAATPRPAATPATSAATPVATPSTTTSDRATRPVPRESSPRERERLGVRIVVNAPVVLGFALLCLVATIAGQVTGGAATHALFSTYRASWSEPLTYLRLVGHVFGHASWEHLISNMTVVLLLGPLLEEKYGRVRLTLVMLVTAVITALANSLVFANRSLLGASGIAFAFILLSSVTDYRKGEIPLTFVLVAVLFLGNEVVQGLFVADSVSNFTHILGGLVGAAAGFALTPTIARKTAKVNKTLR